MPKRPRAQEARFREGGTEAGLEMAGGSVGGEGARRDWSICGETTFGEIMMKVESMPGGLAICWQEYEDFYFLCHI